MTNIETKRTDILIGVYNKLQNAETKTSVLEAFREYDELLSYGSIDQIISVCPFNIKTEFKAA